MEFGLSPVSNSGVFRGPKTPNSPHYPGRHRTRSGGLSASPFTPLQGALPSLQSPGPSSPLLQDSPVSDRVRRVFSALPLASYTLGEQIGEGTFSTVFLARRKTGGREVALKHLIPTSKPHRIVTEVRCMQEAAGHANVIKLLGVWRVGGDVVLAMPYVRHCKFMDLVATAELEEVQVYLANLLAALDHIHRLGIIHRDIKPSNFLYDRRSKQFALVDFGLAQREDGREVAGVRGTKRRNSSVAGEEGGGEVKRPRLPLTETSANKLHCSPRAVQQLRGSAGRGEGVRRSPRKPCSPDGQEVFGWGEQEVLSPTETPRLRLDFPGTAAARTQIRCSPRKLNLGLTSLRRGSGEGGTPSPTLHTPTYHSPTLSRNPSFQETSQTSQATDRLPLFRASLTQYPSSSLQSSSPLPTTPGSSCSCPGHLKVCTSCQALPHLHAARAGTPGFRPPEVLLKFASQTVSVDLWAVGVILLSFLSRSYPFFRAPDDLTALAEITTLFGSKAINKAAQRYGRVVTSSAAIEPQALGAVCVALAERGEVRAGTPLPGHLVTEVSLSLVRGLLALDYRERLTAAEALQHPLLKGVDINRD